jgi:hypothetical protein
MIIAATIAILMMISILAPTADYVRPRLQDLPDGLCDFRLVNL